MCMVDDSEGWVFFTEKIRQARKTYRCDECRRDIARGEQYRYASGMVYGNDTIDVMRQCLHCVAATEWLTEVCSGYLFCAVEEDLTEHVTGEESYLRSAPLTRLVRWMRADWEDRTGSLRPVEDVRTVTASAIAAYRKQLQAVVS